MSIDSLWKVGVKRRWWKGVKNGDVLLFVVSLATVNALYEVSPRAVNSGVARKGLGGVRAGLTEQWCRLKVRAKKVLTRSNDIQLFCVRIL